MYSDCDEYEDNGKFGGSVGSFDSGDSSDFGASDDSLKSNQHGEPGVCG